MIRAEFVILHNKIQSFRVEGHSGLAPAPHDILCASVSAMTMLVLNTLQEVFGAELELTVQEETPRISASVISVPTGREEAAEGVLKGFFLQLRDLERQYPKYLKVSTKTR